MIALCRNPECVEVDVPKDMSGIVLGPDEVVICGECGSNCILATVDRREE